MPQRYIRIIVRGKVQGVFFRKYTLLKAVELNVRGFVKNQKDNSVLIEAVAEAGLMDLFLEYCNTGPSRAIVTAVEIEELAGESTYTDFTFK